MAVEAGTRLGRIVVHDYIGQGSLGTVYRAVDHELGEVAVKVLHRLSDPASRERFRETAPRLVAVRHPNLVGVLAQGEHEGVPYLVEAYVEGTTLAERFRRATMTPASALDALRGMAAGIDHAHSEGLLHGNLKPGQVLMDAGDRPLVSDVGLARLRPHRPGGLAAGLRDGAPEYLALEQVVGGELTDATDRYAFAAIAYQLLVDRPPFEGEPRSVVNAQLRSDPPAPSLRNRALPVAVDTVLLRGLAKDPRARWQTCVELVEALACAVSPAAPPFAVVCRDAPPRPPIAAVRPPAPAPRPELDPPEIDPRDDRPRPGRRRRWRLALAALLLLSALVAAAVAWRTSQPRVVMIDLSVSAVRPGDSFVVTATNLPAGQAGRIELHSDPRQLGLFRADRYGLMRTEVLAPEDAAPGGHVVTLCWESGCHGTAPIDIDDGATPGASSPGQGQPDEVPVAATPAAGATATAARVVRDAGSPSGVPGASASPPADSSPSPSPSPRPSHTPKQRPSRSPRPTSTSTTGPSPSASAYPTPLPNPTPAPYPTPSVRPYRAEAEGDREGDEYGHAYRAGGQSGGRRRRGSRPALLA
jgi:serine/threonine-protein kinase